MHIDENRPERARDERGVTVVEWLMWAAVVVVAIAAIGMALQALGVEVIQFVRGQIFS